MNLEHHQHCRSSINMIELKPCTYFCLSIASPKAYTTVVRSRKYGTNFSDWDKEGEAAPLLATRGCSLGNPDTRTFWRSQVGLAWRGRSTLLSEKTYCTWWRLLHNWLIALLLQLDVLFPWEPWCKLIWRSQRTSMEVTSTVWQNVLYLRKVCLLIDW